MRAMLFEFMDESWTPLSLRQTLRDILEVCNSRPFRLYYDWVVQDICKLVTEKGYTNVVELGAGKAPLTQRLSRCAMEGVTFHATDINPDPVWYRQLTKQGGGRISASLEPVDFSVPQKWAPNTLVVLSVTFHHLPHEQRIRAIQAFEEARVDYMIAEAVRYNFTSLLGCIMTGWLLGFLTPLFLMTKPNNFRRFIWCWLLPVAPWAFVWDGLASCWRCWTENEWDLVMRSLSIDPKHFKISTSIFSLKVSRRF